MNLRIDFRGEFSDKEKLTIATKIQTIIDSAWNYHLFVTKSFQGIHVSDGHKEYLMTVDKQRFEHA